MPSLTKPLRRTTSLPQLVVGRALEVKPMRPLNGVTQVGDQVHCYLQSPIQSPSE